MRERLERAIDRVGRWLARQSEVRRAAVLGVGFGLLLCVVVLLALALLFTIVPRLR
ncbi:MAG: hypothetical protein QJR03_13520 [Sphaerobacter sp.]|nr:hypothetical protein [Sphaerobacter sp.]